MRAAMATEPRTSLQDALAATRDASFTTQMSKFLSYKPVELATTGSPQQSRNKEFEQFEDIIAMDGRTNVAGAGDTVVARAWSVSLGLEIPECDAVEGRWCSSGRAATTRPRKVGPRRSVGRRR